MGRLYVAITHRVGRLDITDIAVVIAVSTPHRADAYAKPTVMRLKGLKKLSQSGKRNIGKMAKNGWAIKETVSYPTGKPEESDLNE